MKRLSDLGNEPMGWHCYLSGQYFKIGKHNRVFVFRNGEWTFTRGISLETINNHLKSKKNKISTDPLEQRKYVTHAHRKSNKKVNPAPITAKEARDAMDERMKVRRT